MSRHPFILTGVTNHYLMLEYRSTELSVSFFTVDDADVFYTTKHELS